MKTGSLVATDRIVSLDLQRGVAIWIMVMLHAFEHTYDYAWAARAPERILELPKLTLVIGGFVAYFGSWLAYFLLISSTVAALGFARRVAAGHDARVARNKQLITGACILLMEIIVGSLLLNFLSRKLQTGSWGDLTSFRNSFFSMGTLDMIGWSTIVTAFITYWLLRNGGVLKVRRNLLIYAGLTIGVIVLSPVIHHWVDGMNWRIPPASELPAHLTMGDHAHWPSVYVQRYNASLWAWFCTIIAGDLEPLFPYLAMAFAGSTVGLAVASLRNDRRVPNIGIIASIVLFAIGIPFILSQGATFGNNRPRPGEFLTMLGGQLFVVSLYLRQVEYRERSQQFAQGFFARRMRLWGMVSLSIFLLSGVVELAPRYLAGLFIRLTGGQVQSPFLSSAFGLGQEYKAILFAVFAMLFFDRLIVWWSRVNFKYSLEWFIVAITSLYTRERSQRLHVDKLINQHARPQVAGVQNAAEVLSVVVLPGDAPKQ